MPFLRMPSPSNAQLIVSRCAACGAFLGAARNKKLLSMVEAVHRCSEKGKKQPVKKDKIGRKGSWLGKS